MYCKICGEWDCKEHEFKVGKIAWKREFSGSTPPEIFVGKWNYPNVYTGILSPQEYGNTEILSSPEKWKKLNVQIPDIMAFRSKLIYGRTRQDIKAPRKPSRFTQVMSEVAMTHKSVATEFILKKPIKVHDEQEKTIPLIAHAASVERVSLQENAPVKQKIDYLVNDSSVKSATAIQELNKSGISVYSIMKVLSAGLLGLKTNRKMVPTRWSITAVDDTISKKKLEKIHYFQELSEIKVFTAEYLGNHYEFILLPGTYSFEVIELSIQTGLTWQDYESQFPRKVYAESVTGAYYANRLALTEYLESIRRQAQCLVIREVRPEYYAPCGVGILREASREAFSKPHQTFSTMKEAFQNIQTRLRTPIEKFTEKSKILENYGKQKRLTEFFS